MSGAVRTIARLEFVTVIRQRWVRLFAVAFALLTLAASYSSGALEELGGAEGFARTTVSLIPLVLVLVPLAALLLGVSGHTGEPGGEAFLFAQPVSRFEVLLGKWLGQTLSLGGALLAGFGAGALALTAAAGPEGLPRFLVFVAACLLLAAAFLAVAAAVSARCSRRTAALGVAAFAWFFFVLLFDALALAAAGWLTGRAGARALFLSVFANPADLTRVLALSLAGTPHVLGAAGDAWLRFLGGPVPAVGLSVAALAAWVALPLEVARRAIARRDL